MADKWSNWSGSLEFEPGRIVKPEGEEEVREIVRGAARSGMTVRPVGKGHSSTPLVRTGQTLMSLEKLTGVVEADPEAREARVRPGTTLEQMGEQLLETDLAIHNLGDVNVQHLGGAVGTGTHGTGNALGNLSTMVKGVRMVDGHGEIVERHVEDDPDFVRAARVAMGTLGVFTELRIALLPAYRLHRQEWCTGFAECMEHLNELIERNRNFDFYWYPRSDEVKLRTLNPPGETPEIPYAELLDEKVEWAPRIISKTRDLKFDEIEYALPFGQGPEAFRKLRERILDEHRRDVGWRTLYRTTAPDDAMLSPSYGRPTATLSAHQNATLEFEEFFDDIEPIFIEHEGRPHWGKKHSLAGDELAELYPEWESFHEIRAEYDPDGTFLTPYLRELFGLDEEQDR